MRHYKLQRSGLTIIEVLTSIVVAMIGVLGIMVLIPFSVKQSQSGLDRDAATMLARSAMAQLEVRGYRNPTNWIDATGPVDPTAPQTYMLDPYGAATNAAFLNFPNLLIGNMPYTIPTASLDNGLGVAMSRADAQRMFMNRNELHFGEELDELLGPRQVYDDTSVAALSNVRRQFRGSLSWTVLMVPFKSINTDVGAAWSYRSYVIVYKNRKYDATVNPDPDGFMFAAQVVPPTPTGLMAPIGSVYVDGTATPLPDDYNLARDSWVMLINQRDTMGAPPAAEMGFEKQVGFYRVVNYDIDATSGVRLLRSVTLDGPDFDFGDPADTANWDPQGTYMVHLRDVVAVYERSIVPESVSTWGPN